MGIEIDSSNLQETGAQGPSLSTPLTIIPTSTKTHPLVYIVYDEELIRFSIESFLNRRGFETRCIGDGQEALLLIDYQQPDIIITDLRMILLKKI